MEGLGGGERWGEHAPGEAGELERYDRHGGDHLEDQHKPPRLGHRHDIPKAARPETRTTLASQRGVGSCNRFITACDSLEPLRNVCIYPTVVMMVKESWVR